jgi:hypothetical protein
MTDPEMKFPIFVDISPDSVPRAQRLVISGPLAQLLIVPAVAGSIADGLPANMSGAPRVASATLEEK